jgi:hypothetical protein
MKRIVWVLLWVFITGCGGGSSAPSDTVTVPTISGYVGRGTLTPLASAATSDPSQPPTDSPYFKRDAFVAPPTPTRHPTATPSTQKIREPNGTVIASAKSPQASRVISLTIYDEKLDPNWTFDFSRGMEIDPADTTHPHTGTKSIAIVPLQDYGTALLSVRQGVTQTYPYSAVLGISFWLNSGADTLNTDALAVTVLGSNDYGYYQPNDKSVVTDAKNFFSETRLYYLGINRSIPPNTWVPIMLWLDSLPYDPPYKNVTGIYLKNDASFRQTFYVDQVELLMAK